LLLTQDFLISVYNLLEVGSSYRSDLVDLFGTPDGSKKGFIGSSEKFLCWDWGETGFRKITNILYCLSRKKEGFEEFYRQNILRKNNIIQVLIDNKIIDQKPQMLYIFKHSSKKIPAFIAKIDEVSWKERRIWITFKPTSYMLIDPKSWKEFWNRLFTKGREDPEKWYDTWDQSWNQTRPSKDMVEFMVHSSMTQDQFHIIPIKFLLETIKEKANPLLTRPRTIFLKNVSKNKKRAKLGVPTDNQAFWGVLSEIIGKTQVKGTVDLKKGGMYFQLIDIPANTISEESLVFKQEIGTARVICQVMLDIFGNDYLQSEFTKGNKKSILDSVFMKRATKVMMVAENYNKKYSETDYDYGLDLTPLNSKYPKLDVKILFDLTAGLWNKGIAKDKDEFVKQWEHNLIQVPEKNEKLYSMWHYGLISEIKDGSYKGLEIGDYLKKKAKNDVIKYHPNAIKNLSKVPKLILMPFFRDSSTRLETELRQISSNKDKNRRKSMLYGALKEILEKLKE
jgi:hypothetical protein